MVVCPKPGCHLPAWAPYLMTVKGKYGQVYTYQVYRHSLKVKPRDGRNPAKTPQKCTIKVVEPVAQ